MTITVSNSSQLVAGDGVTTTFNFGFVGDSSSVISVYYINAAGSSTLLAPGLYSIALNAAVTNQIWGVGGTITYPLSGSPIATGTSLLIQRLVPYQQSITTQNQGNFYAQVTERAMDLLAMQIQQVASRTTQYRGIWLTGTSYSQGDIVQDGSNGNNTLNYYICAIANTSRTWSTDLAAGDWTVSVLAAIPTGNLTLTGDITGSGASPVATTLATVNASPGSYTNATVTVNSKGLITAATSGSAGGTGTVTSVSYTGDGVLQSNVASTPVTTSGTIAATLLTQAKNIVLAGPGSGANAAPTFRALVAADLPIATSSAVGGVKPDGTIITVSGAGAITVPNATSGAKGVVQVDGTTITASSGVITSKPLMTALAVGSIIMAYNTTGSDVAAAATLAAASLTPYNLAISGGTNFSQSDSLSGTWQALQNCKSHFIGLWQRTV